MSDGLYDYGLDQWKTFTTDTVRALLLKGTGYTFSKAHHFVSDLTPASNEAAGAGYARVTLASKTRTVDTTNHRITYDAADPAFGSIATGETESAVVVYVFGTADSDSVLLAYYDITDTPTDGAAFTPTIGANGLHYYDQGA